jgi:hypothetical protein
MLVEIKKFTTAKVSSDTILPYLSKYFHIYLPYLSKIFSYIFSYLGKEYSIYLNSFLGEYLLWMRMNKEVHIS